MPGTKYRLFDSPVVPLLAGHVGAVVKPVSVCRLMVIFDPELKSATSPPAVTEDVELRTFPVQSEIGDAVALNVLHSVLHATRRKVDAVLAWGPRSSGTRKRSAGLNHLAAGP